MSTTVHTQNHLDLSVPLRHQYPFPHSSAQPLTERSKSTIGWLDGFTGTASAFGSILGENDTRNQELALPKPRIQSLSLFPRVQSVRSSTRRVSEGGPQWIGAAF
jgi:hypothetical protein